MAIGSMKCSKCGYTQLASSTCKSCGSTSGGSQMVQQPPPQTQSRPPQPTANYYSLLKAVGVYFIVIGFLDIVVVIYGITHGLVYTCIIFGIFAVAGILLLRGSLKTAHVVAWLSALVLAFSIGVFLLAPFIIPLDQIIAYRNRYWHFFWGSIVLWIRLMIFLRQIYWRLTDGTIFSAMEDAKIDYRSFWRKPSTGFIAGILLSVMLFVFLGLVLGGVPPDQAKARELIKRVTSYKLFVTSPPDAAAQTISWESTPLSVLDVPANAMKSYLADAYRLKPDNRFMLAVSDIHSFFTGQKKEYPSFQFQKGYWHIRYRNLDVGDLPEWPDYSDFKKVLTRWVKTLNQRNQILISSEEAPDQKEIDQELSKLLSYHVTHALQRINTDWRSGEHLQGYLPLASRGLVLLTLQEFDRVETADDLTAKAWAMLTTTQALTPYQMIREESLFANLLGYLGSACQLAKTLPDEDPIRLYILNEQKALFALAENHPEQIEAKYLALIKISQKGTMYEWLSWAEKNFDQDKLSLPIIMTGLNRHYLEADEGILSLLPKLVLIQMYFDEHLPKSSPLITKISAEANLTQAVYLNRMKEAILFYFQPNVSSMELVFDKMVETEGGKYTGPFLDKETFEIYYRSYFYSALYSLGMFYKDSLSSVVAVNQFNSQLQKYSAGMANDFQQWYGHLATFKQRNDDLNLLMEDIQTLPTFGAAPLLKTFEVLKNRSGWGYPDLTKAVKLLTRRMDTRITHRIELSAMSYSSLQDVKLTSRLVQSVIEATYPQGEINRAWYASLTRDSEQLIEIVHMENADWDDRVYALEFLVKHKGLPSKSIQEEFEKLISERPVEWKIHSKYIAYLEEIKDYEKGLSVVDHWLKHHKYNDFDVIFARTAVARMYYYEGRYEEGLKAVLPVVKSYQGGAMERAALLLDKVGKTDDAETLMNLTLERYPDSVRTRALMAELLWRHEKYGDAAKILRSSPIPISSADWLFEIADHFKEVFVNEPNEKGQAAFEALIRSGIIPWNLINIPRPIAKAGNNELAFKLLSRMRAQAGGLGDVEFLTEAYQYRKAWQGQEAALSWLRKGIPGPLVNPSSMIFFEQKQYELLWTFIQDPQGDGSDFIWLLRAAAFLKSGGSMNSHKPELMQYYSSHNSRISIPYYSSYYDQIGRYLMGLQSEEETIALAKTDKQKCEVSYYLGVKAESEGRMEDASDWYRVSVETGLEKNGEFRYALNQLYYWYSSGKSLPLIAMGKEDKIL